MKIRNLMHVGLLGAALTVSATAQQYDPRYDGGGRYAFDQRAERRDVERDVRKRDELARRVEADRRDVEHERNELHRSNWFTAGRESRELRRAQDRLNRDLSQLREMDEHIARDLHRGR